MRKFLISLSILLIAIAKCSNTKVVFLGPKSQCRTEICNRFASTVSRTALKLVFHDINSKILFPNLDQDAVLNYEAIKYICYVVLKIQDRLSFNINQYIDENCEFDSESNVQIINSLAKKFSDPFYTDDRRFCKILRQIQYNDVFLCFAIELFASKYFLLMDSMVEFDWIDFCVKTDLVNSFEMSYLDKKNFVKDVQIDYADIQDIFSSQKVSEVFNNLLTNNNPDIEIIIACSPNYYINEKLDDFGKESLFLNHELSQKAKDFQRFINELCCQAVSRWKRTKEKHFDNIILRCKKKKFRPRFVLFGPIFLNETFSFKFRNKNVLEKLITNKKLETYDSIVEKTYEFAYIFFKNLFYLCPYKSSLPFTKSNKITDSCGYLAISALFVQKIKEETSSYSHVSLSILLCELIQQNCPFDFYLKTFVKESDDLFQNNLSTKKALLPSIDPIDNYKLSFEYLEIMNLIFELVIKSKFFERELIFFSNVYNDSEEINFSLHIVPELIKLRYKDDFKQNIYKNIADLVLLEMKMCKFFEKCNCKSKENVIVFLESKNFLEVLDSISLDIKCVNSNNILKFNTELSDTPRFFFEYEVMNLDVPCKENSCFFRSNLVLEYISEEDSSDKTNQVKKNQKKTVRKKSKKKTVTKKQEINQAKIQEDESNSNEVLVGNKNIPFIQNSENLKLYEIVEDELIIQTEFTRIVRKKPKTTNKNEVRIQNKKPEKKKHKAQNLILNDFIGESEKQTMFSNEKYFTTERKNSVSSNTDRNISKNQLKNNLRTADFDLMKKSDRISSVSSLNSNVRPDFTYSDIVSGVSPIYNDSMKSQSYSQNNNSKAEIKSNLDKDKILVQPNNHHINLKHSVSMNNLKDIQDSKNLLMFLSLEDLNSLKSDRLNYEVEIKSSKFWAHSMRSIKKLNSFSLNRQKSIKSRNHSEEFHTSCEELFNSEKINMNTKQESDDDNIILNNSMMEKSVLDIKKDVLHKEFIKNRQPNSNQKGQRTRLGYPSEIPVEISLSDLLDLIKAPNDYFNISRLKDKLIFKKLKENGSFSKKKNAEEIFTGKSLICHLTDLIICKEFNKLGENNQEIHKTHDGFIYNESEKKASLNTKDEVAPLQRNFEELKIQEISNTGFVWKKSELKSETDSQIKETEDISENRKRPEDCSKNVNNSQTKFNPIEMTFTGIENSERKLKKEVDIDIYIDPDIFNSSKLNILDEIEAREICTKNSKQMSIEIQCSEKLNFINPQECSWKIFEMLFQREVERFVNLYGEYISAASIYKNIFLDIMNEKSHSIYGQLHPNLSNFCPGSIYTRPNYHSIQNLYIKDYKILKIYHELNNFQLGKSIFQGSLDRKLFLLNDNPMKIKIFSHYPIQSLYEIYYLIQSPYSQYIFLVFRPCLKCGRESCLEYICSGILLMSKLGIDNNLCVGKYPDSDIFFALHCF